MYKTLKCGVGVGMCECVFVNVWRLNLCLLEVSEFFSFFLWKYLLQDL